MKTAPEHGDEHQTRMQQRHAVAGASVGLVDPAEPLHGREVLCVSQFTLYGDVRRGKDKAQEADKAADILDDCGAVDIKERAQEWRQSGWAGSPQSSAGGSLAGDDARVRDGAEKVIPVVKEEVQVGKSRRGFGRWRGTSCHANQKSAGKKPGPSHHCEVSPK